MTSVKFVYFYFMAGLLSVTSLAYSQNLTQSFEIHKGVVKITPGFCIPENCIPTSAELNGTFSSEINGDAIAFSNIDISSAPETGFILPKAPNESSDGTNRRAIFSFDGVHLMVKGVVDSRAFDGPLYEYKFIAQLNEALGFDAKGYYSARQNNLDCISPVCGGIFVKSVNKRLTKCADGSKRDVFHRRYQIRQSKKRHGVYSQIGQDMV